MEGSGQGRRTVTVERAPNARDWAVEAWERASVESKARFLLCRNLLGKTDPESMRAGFLRYLDGVLGCDP